MAISKRTGIIAGGMTMLTTGSVAMFMLLSGTEDLQARLDNAQCGETVALTASASYIGNFRLRNKGCTAANPIIITTAGFDVPAGQRVVTADDTKMARILAPGNGLPVIEADAGAGFYRFMGVYLSVNYGSDPAKQYGSSFLITLGNGNDSNPNYGKWLSHDIAFDRCHVAGKFNDSRFAFAIAGERITVINSLVNEFAGGRGTDSGGFLFTNAGGHLIENNLISAGMWMIDMGGADSDSPNRGKVISATTSSTSSSSLTLSTTLDETEGTSPAVGDLIAFYIRPAIADSTWKAQTSYPLGTLQFHHSKWTIEAQKPPLLFYTTVGGVSGTTEPDWNALDEYHNQTAVDGTATWRLFNGNYQVGKVTAVSGTMITCRPEGPTGIFLLPVVGSIAKWNGYNPSVTVRRNHFLRPSYWANFDAPNKGMVQIKNAIDSLFEGNFWEVEPGQSPNEEYNRNHRPGLFALTPGNQSYSAPWSTARNITFRYNHARHIESVFNWSLTDYVKTNLVGGNNIAHDNLFEDVWHGFALVTTGFNVTFTHNTIINQSEKPLLLFGGKVANLVYTDNIVGWYAGPYFEYGDLFLSNVNGGSEAGNVFVDVDNRTGEGYPPTKYFPDSLVAKTWAGVKLQPDGRLTPDSPFKGRGTNGSDPGADISKIEAATGGSLPASTPTPTSTPSPTASSTPTPIPTPTSQPSPSPAVSPTLTPTPSPSPASLPLTRVEITAKANIRSGPSVSTAPVGVANTNARGWTTGGRIKDPASNFWFIFIGFDDGRSGYVADALVRNR